MRPAIILSGADADRDQRHIDRMVKGHLARGRALILWALSFADDSSLPTQTKLTMHVGAARLKTDATWVEFNLYVQGLHEKWARIKANANAPTLLGVYQQLLVGLPTEPASAHLTTLRTYLATWVAAYERLESGEAMPKGAPRLHDLDLALDDLRTQSNIIGMRHGTQDDKVTRGIVAALGGQTDALCLQCGDLDNSQPLIHALADASERKKHRDKPHSNAPRPPTSARTVTRICANRRTMVEQLPASVAGSRSSMCTSMAARVKHVTAHCCARITKRIPMLPR